MKLQQLEPLILTYSDNKRAPTIRTLQNKTKCNILVPIYTKIPMCQKE